MKIKHFLLVFLIGLFAIGLTACRLPASTPPEPTPTVEEGGFPIPGAGTETMGLFETIATQTAMASSGEPAPGVTPEPPAVEALRQNPWGKNLLKPLPRSQLPNSRLLSPNPSLQHNPPLSYQNRPQGCQRPIPFKKGSSPTASPEDLTSIRLTCSMRMGWE
jgi:hypothetical protein